MSKEEAFDLVEVYKREIQPLMEKIAEICIENKIPFLAACCVGNSGGKEQLCTSFLSFGKDRSSLTLLSAAREIVPDDVLLSSVMENIKPN